MSSAVRTIPSPSQDHCKLSLADIKRMKRQASRKYFKLQRKVATMRKLRDETYNLNRQIGFLKEEENRVSSFMYQPDPKPSDY